MPKFHARNASIYCDSAAAASTSISADLNSAELTYSMDAPDVTGFGDNTRQRLHGGLIEWELSVDGFVNHTGSTTAACILMGLLNAGGSTLIYFGPAGSTSGSPKYTGCAVLTEFSQSYGTEDAAAFSATFQSRSGSLTASAW